MSPNVKTTRENFFHRFDVRWKFFHRIRNRERILELGCGVGLNYQSLETLNNTKSDINVSPLVWHST